MADMHILHIPRANHDPVAHAPDPEICGSVVAVRVALVGMLSRVLQQVAFCEADARKGRRRVHVGKLQRVERVVVRVGRGVVAFVGGRALSEWSAL